MKRAMVLLFLLLFMLTACAPDENETTGSSGETQTTQEVTVNPEDLPDVFSDASSFYDVGQIEITAPEGADEVTRIILYDEICQVQFTYNDIFYTYRAAFASTGRSGYTLTEIAEEANYLSEDVRYGNDTVDYAFEAYLLDGGNLLLWSDGNINYSLASLGGSFDDFCQTADLIIK